MSESVDTHTVRVEGAAHLRRGEARTFPLTEGARRGGGFVIGVGHEGDPVAFINRCPHVGFDLDMGTGSFYSEKLDRIYCRTHGATFDVRDGVCDGGPCLGQPLMSLGARVDGDDVLVEVPNPSTE